MPFSYNWPLANDWTSIDLRADLECDSEVRLVINHAGGAYRFNLERVVWSA